MAGICNSVGGGFLTCHRGAGAGGEYRSVSRLGLLIGNRWMSRRDQIPAVLECANCSRQARDSMDALSETVATVSLSTVPRLSLLSRQCCLCLRVGSREEDAWGKAGGVADWTDSPCVHAIK